MSDEPTLYAIRIAPAVRQAIDDERDRLLSEYGVDAAIRWLDSVDTALSSLSIFPERCAIARESVLISAHVRQLLLPPRRPRWRLLFTVHEGADEAPTVRIQLIRHVAQAPLTNWPPEDAEI